jgi:branched-chain amino acid aminotransferase
VPLVPGSIEPLVWLNGVLQRNARVSVHDRGLTLADGLFETLHVKRAKAFRLERHLARLAQGLAAMEIPYPAALGSWLERAVTKQSVETFGGEAGLRITVTRGAGPAGVRIPRDVEPTVVITLGAMPAFGAIYETGLSVHVASGCRNERAMTAGLKTLAYTDAVAALLEARRAGADEALFLDTDGHCSEATASNLFVWTGSTLVTPPIGCGALPGITREAVIELASAQGLETVERPCTLQDLHGAKEAFLTSSLRGLAPVVRVGEILLADGVPGPVTARLSAAYRALVDRECGT